MWNQVWAKHRTVKNKWVWWRNTQTKCSNKHDWETHLFDLKYSKYLEFQLSTFVSNHNVEDVTTWYSPLKVSLCHKRRPNLISASAHLRTIYTGDGFVNQNRKQFYVDEFGWVTSTRRQQAHGQKGRLQSGGSGCSEIAKPNCVWARMMERYTVHTYLWQLTRTRILFAMSYRTEQKDIWR